MCLSTWPEFLVAVDNRACFRAASRGQRFLVANYDQPCDVGDTLVTQDVFGLCAAANSSGPFGKVATTDLATRLSFAGPLRWPYLLAALQLFKSDGKPPHACL